MHVKSDILQSASEPRPTLRGDDETWRLLIEAMATANDPRRPAPQYQTPLVPAWFPVFLVIAVTVGCVGLALLGEALK